MWNDCVLLRFLENCEQSLETLKKKATICAHLSTVSQRLDWAEHWSTLHNWAFWKVFLKFQYIVIPQRLQQVCLLSRSTPRFSRSQWKAVWEDLLSELVESRLILCTYRTILYCRLTGIIGQLHRSPNRRSYGVSPFDEGLEQCANSMSIPYNLPTMFHQEWTARESLKSFSNIA